MKSNFYLGIIFSDDEYNVNNDDYDNIKWDSPIHIFEENEDDILWDTPVEINQVDATKTMDESNIDCGDISFWETPIDIYEDEDSLNNNENNVDCEVSYEKNDRVLF